LTDFRSDLGLWLSATRHHRHLGSSVPDLDDRR